MHEYQKRSNSPNLAASHAYQKKLAADKASSSVGSSIPTNNPGPTNLTGKKRLLPSQMLQARMMAKMQQQQANAVDSTDKEQQVQGKGDDWQQKADLNAIFSNGSALSSGSIAKYENLMPGVSLGNVSLHQGSQVDVALQTAGLHGLTDGTNVAVASTAPAGTLEHEIGHVGQRQEQGFSLDEGNRQAHETDADEIAGKLLANQPVERFEQTASAKKRLLPSQILEARLAQQMQARLMSKDIATSTARGIPLQQQPKLLGASEGTEQQEQRFPQEKSSTDQHIPQADGNLYAIIDGGVISIPLAVGTLLVVVGAAGIIINWKDITGTLTQLGQIGVDWVNDTVSGVTTRIINVVSQVPGASRNILEGARGAIEGVVSQVFESRRGNTSGNNEAQNAQFKDAVRAIERRIRRKLNKDEIRRLHEAISGEGYDFHDIISLGVDMFGNPEDQSEDDEDYDD